MTEIIIKNTSNSLGDNTNPYLRPDGIILPCTGDSQLMCKCGNRTFVIGVTPTMPDEISQRANIHEVICIQCKHSVKVRVDGLLETDGEYGKETVRHRESDEYKSTLEQPI